MTRPLLIAQNLNASDLAVAAALAAGDASWLRGCARRIAATGVDLIDCNAGTFGADEAQLLEWMAGQVEAMTSLPLSLDSAAPKVLSVVAAHRRRPCLLNSLPLDFEWSAALESRLTGTANTVVLALRRGRELPEDAGTRRRWAEAGLARLTGYGVQERQVYLDAIALPWGDAVDAGRPMLDFVSGWAASGTGAGTLVGLGNLGYGHRDLVRIHQEWMVRLCDAGISAVLLDAFEPGLRSHLPPRAPAS